MEVTAKKTKSMVFAVTGLANLLSTFMTTSVSLSLPILAAQFQVSMGTVSWVSLIYILTLSCTLMIFGRLGDLIGYKKIFVTGYALFGISSLLLPIFAVNLQLILIFRVLQALGGSMLLSINQAIVSKTFPASERGRALGINSVFASVGIAVGPTIGGILIQYFGWQAIYFFNIPFSLVGIYTSMKYINITEDTTTQKKKMDWTGGVIFGVMILALSVALQFVDDWGIADTRILAGFAVFIVMLVGFILLEKKSKAPLMNLGLFSNKNFSLPTFGVFGTFMTQMMITFLIPFFLANIMKYDSSKSGMVMLATPLLQIIFAPQGGKWCDRSGTKKPAIFGLAILAIGCGIMSQMKVGTSIALVVVALAICGFGNGFNVSAINTAIMGAVPREHSGVASSMVATVRNIGQFMGVALGNMIITMRSATYGQTVADGRVAYVMAQRDCFFFMICVVALAIFAMSMTPNVRKNAPAAAANTSVSK